MAKVGEVFVKLFMDSDEFTDGIEEAERGAEQLEERMQETGRTIRGVIGDISERFGRMGEGMIDTGENLTQAIGLPFLLLGTLAVMAAKETKKGEKAVKKLADGFKKLKKALAPVGQAILDMAVKYMPKFINMVERISKWFQNLSPQMKELVIALGGLIVALGPVLMFGGALVLMLGGLGQALTFLSGPIGWIVAALGLLAAKILKTSKGAEPFFNMLDKLGKIIREKVNAALDKLSKVNWEQLGKNMVQGIRNAFDKLGDLTDKITAWIDKIDWAKVTQTFLTKAGKFVVGVVKEIDKKTGEHLEKGETTQAAHGFGVWLGKAIVNGTKNLKAIEASIKTAISEALAGVISSAMTAQEGRKAGESALAPHAFIIGLFQGMFSKINLESLGKYLWETLPAGFAQSLLQSAAEKISGQKVENINWEPLKQKFKQSLNRAFNPANLKWDDDIGLIDLSKLVKWDSLKPDAEKAWDGLKQIVKNKINELRNNANSVLEGLKKIVSNKWNNIKTNASTAWENIKKAITKPIEDAYDTITGIIDKIKKAFSSMKITIPKPKLPQVDVNWVEVAKGAARAVIPKFRFFASGGIVNGATAGVIGEAGPEAVVPLSGRRMEPFAKAIASQMGIGGGLNITVNNYTDNEKIGYSTARAVSREMWLYGLY
ncbi:hypothetical protein ACFO25_09890 [Paenactinomyces guangxiensis]|uniref:Phage tail tape measure protein n=1 Tax=Paenactinomyces guangxiensis TaxID=1490290 RepID=A0A7W2A8X9_9BACL|nr:hypothetical protein [Paenactinomyces guangxiensis]MBA4495095.1 hypothetical protein [Paenactinomyces guangxiensis]MBH8592221.1 hypothetical protein [Paenactinomyces guangxiensis]